MTTRTEESIQATAPGQATAAIMSSTSSARLSLWHLLRVWFMLGVQSFGGGMATLYLLQRTAVDKHRWLTAEEFAHDFALCQAAPGINLLCMTILVGRRVAGLAGSIVSLVGLLLPSITLTILMTALYADLRTLPVVQAALRGIVPATIGLGLLLTVNMTRPLLAASRRESQLGLLVGLLLLVGSALAVVIGQAPVIVVLLSAGLIGAMTAWGHAVRRQPKPTKVSQS